MNRFYKSKTYKFLETLEKRIRDLFLTVTAAFFEPGIKFGRWVED